MSAAATATATPARRAWLSGAAAAVAAFGGAAASSAPAVASSEIAGAIADYWARAAECNAPGAGDELIDAKCDEIEDAAARIAAAPCRSVADLAAKIVFLVELMNHQNVWQCVASAEGEVLVSVEADVLALVGKAA